MDICTHSSRQYLGLEVIKLCCFRPDGAAFKPEGRNRREREPGTGAGQEGGKD